MWLLVEYSKYTRKHRKRGGKCLRCSGRGFIYKERFLNFRKKNIKWKTVLMTLVEIERRDSGCGNVSTAKSMTGCWIWLFRDKSKDNPREVACWWLVSDFPSCILEKLDHVAQKVFCMCKRQSFLWKGDY